MSHFSPIDLPHFAWDSKEKKLDANHHNLQDRSILDIFGSG